MIEWETFEAVPWQAVDVERLLESLPRGVGRTWVLRVLDRTLKIPREIRLADLAEGLQLAGRQSQLRWLVEECFGWQLLALARTQEELVAVFQVAKLGGAVQEAAVRKLADFFKKE